MVIAKNVLNCKTQGHTMMCATSPFPSFESVSPVKREERICNYKLNLLCRNGPTSYNILACSAPSKAPLGETLAHVQESNLGTSKTFCHLIKSAQTHGIDDSPFSTHFTPKWTDKVKCSQPIFLIRREGKLRADALSEE